jgi:hypothetical protein
MLDRTINSQCHIRIDRHHTTVNNLNLKKITSVWGIPRVSGHQVLRITWIWAIIEVQGKDSMGHRISLWDRLREATIHQVKNIQMTIRIVEVMRSHKVWLTALSQATTLHHQRDRLMCLVELITTHSILWQVQLNHQFLRIRQGHIFHTMLVMRVMTKCCSDQMDSNSLDTINNNQQIRVGSLEEDSTQVIRFNHIIRIRCRHLLIWNHHYQEDSQIGLHTNTSLIYQHRLTLSQRISSQTNHTSVTINHPFKIKEISKEIRDSIRMHSHLHTMNSLYHQHREGAKRTSQRVTEVRQMRTYHQEQIMNG